MKEKLINLKNVLALIETKGENTKIMADCLRYTEQLINECEILPTNDNSNSNIINE